MNPNATNGKNIIEIDNLNILESDRTLKKFNSITLIPQYETIDSKDYLTYKIQVVSDEGLQSEVSTLPCPPCKNCKPQCPPDCTPACTYKDSIDGGLIIPRNADSTGGGK